MKSDQEVTTGIQFRLRKDFEGQKDFDLVHIES